LSCGVLTTVMVNQYLRPPCFRPAFGKPEYASAGEGCGKRKGREPHGTLRNLTKVSI